LATFWFDIHERSEKEPFKPPTNHPTHRDANAVRSLQLSRTLLITPQEVRPVMRSPFGKRPPNRVPNKL